ncbi:hypothetical protein HDV01_001773 [Terramyces sp. JEL0728]|nr:hypothetical protein HDV01_001773 [Terramyces sp. JEL0728]
MSTFGKAAVKRFTHSGKNNLTIVTETPGPTAYSVDQSSILNNDPNKHFGFLEKKERFKELVKEQGNPEDTDYASETSEIKPAIRKVSGGEKEELLKFRVKLAKMEEQYERKLQSKEKDYHFIQERLNKAEAMYNNAVKEKNMFQSSTLVKEKELVEVNRKLNALRLKLDKEEKIASHFNEKMARSDVLQRKVEEMEKLQGKQKSLVDRKVQHENESLSHDLQKYKSRLELLESEKLKLDSTVSQLQQDRNSLKSKLAALQTTYENAKEVWKSSEDKFKEEYREIRKRFVGETEKSSAIKKELSTVLSHEQQKAMEREKKYESLQTSSEAQKNAYLARIQNLETDLDITERALSTKEDSLAAMVEEVEVLKQTMDKRKLDYEKEIKILKDMIAEKDLDLEHQNMQIADRLKKIQTEKLEFVAQKENDKDKFEKTIFSLQSTIQQYQADTSAAKKEYEFQINNYEQQVANLKQEIKVSKQNMQLQSDNCTKLQAQVLKYQSTIKDHRESSESIVQDLQVQLENIREEYEKLSKNKTLEHEVHDKEMYSLRAEIESINNDLQAKIAVLEQDNLELSEKCTVLGEQCQTLKKQYEHELFIYQEKLELKNSHLDEMNEKYDALIIENNSTCKDFERQVHLLGQKVEDLLTSQKQKEEEYNENRAASVAQIAKHLKTIDQLKSESLKTHERATGELGECRQEIEKLRLENEVLNQKCVSKEEAFATSCRDRELDQQKMQKNCDTMVEKLKSKDEMLMGRDQKINDLTSELTGLKQSKQLTVINHKKALDEMELALKEKDAHSQSLFKKVERLEAALNEERLNIENKDSNFAKLRKELADSQSLNFELSEAKSQCEIKISKLEGLVDEKKDKISSLESINSSLESSKEMEHRNFLNSSYQIKQLESETEELKAQLQDSSNEAERLKETLATAKAKTADMQLSNSNLSTKVESLESSLKMLERELGESKHNLEETTTTLNDVVESRKSLQKTLSVYKKDLEEAVNANEQANEEITASKLKEKKLQTTIQALESKLESGKSDLLSIKKELEGTRLESADRSDSVNQLNSQLLQLKQELAKRTQAYDQVNGQLKDANFCISQNTEEMNALKQRMQREMKVVSEERDAEADKAATILRKLSACEADLKELQNRNLDLMESYRAQTEDLKICQEHLQKESNKKAEVESTYNRLDDQCKMFKSQVAELENRNRLLKSEYSSNSQEYHSSLEAKDRKVVQLQNELSLLSQQREDMQNSLNEIVKRLKMDKNTLEMELASVQSDVSAGKIKLTGAEAKIEALAELSTLQAKEKEELSASHDLAIKKLNDKFHKEREEIQQKYISQFNEHKSKFHREQKEMEEKLTVLQSENQEWNEKYNDYFNKYTILSNEMLESISLNDQNSQEISKLNSAIQDAIAEKVTIERELVHTKELYSDYRKNVETIENESQMHLREVQELKAKLLHESELKAMAQQDYTGLRESFKVQFNDINESNKMLEKEKAILSKKLEVEIQKLSERLSEKNNEVHQLEIKLSTATGANDRYELKLSNEIGSREIKFKQLEAKLAEQAKENVKLSETIASLIKEKESINTLMRSELKKEVEKQSEIWKTRSDADKLELSLVIEELKKSEIAKNNDISRLNSQLNTAVMESENLKESHNNQLEKLKQLGKLTSQEIQQVASEKASLYGHTNANQKIKHLQKVTEENLKLKADKIELERDRDMYKRRALNLDRELEAQKALAPSDKPVSRVARSFKNRAPAKPEEKAAVEQKENVVTQLGASSGGFSFIIE